MEGPSLFLAKEQLAPFKKHMVVSVSGNTRIEKAALQDKSSKIFSAGANTFSSSSTASP